MNGAATGKRNIIIIIVLLALFDIAAIILLALFPHVLPGFAETFGTGTEQMQSDTAERVEATDDSTASDAAGTDAMDSESDAVARTPEPSNNGDSSGATESDADSGEDSAAVPENFSQIEPIAAGERRVVSRHRAVKRDTFYTLTGQIWGEEHLWPDLYQLNSSEFPNPDFIAQGARIDIYERLDGDGKLTDRELATLLDAYVRTYSTYRELGERALARGRDNGSKWDIQLGRIRINKAHWLLYSGLRFHHGFIDDFSERIQDRDERVVRNYVERFGYPDP